MVVADPASLHSSASLLAPQQAKASNGAALFEKSVAGSRRPRIKEVTSRYKSPTNSLSLAPATSSRRFPSPNVDRVTSSPDVATSPKRAQSAERRRPSPARTTEPKVSNGSVAGASALKRVPGRPDLLWPSSRSSSSSLQGELYSPSSNGSAKGQFDDRHGKFNSQSPDHTLKSSANVVHRQAEHRKGTPERKGTPLRRQSIDQAENARPLENVHSKIVQHRRQPTSNGKLFGAAMSKSMDLSMDREKPLSKAASMLLQANPTSNASRVSRSVASSRTLSQSVNQGPATSTPSNGTSRPTTGSRGRSRDSLLVTRKIPSREAVQDISLQRVDTQTGLEAQPIGQSEQDAVSATSDVTMIADSMSDTESVSSGGTAGASSSSNRSIGNGTVRVARGTTVPARYWQDAASRSRRLSESNRLRSSMPESELATITAAMGKLVNRQKTHPPLEAQSRSVHGLVTSSPWSFSPNRSVSAFSSPQQSQTASPMRSLPSPIRSRGLAVPLPPNGLQINRSSSVAAVLSFGVDTRKGKKGLSQLEEAHLVRLLHNRLLQWRFVNARAVAAMHAQRLAAEKLLYSVWAKTSELRALVTTKRIKLQQARQAYKLNSILSAQALKLEDWSILQQEHSVALLGAVQALEAAMLRVPVTGGVRADTQAVKEAMGSASDVLNAVESLVTSFFPKAEKTNHLVSELAQVASHERSLLEECSELLATAASYEVEECSLRTHLMELEQEKVRVLGHLLDSGTAGTDSVLLSSP